MQCSKAPVQDHKQGEASVGDRKTYTNLNDPILPQQDIGTHQKLMFKAVFQ
jgi:hypothetical protein